MAVSVAIAQILEANSDLVTTFGVRMYPDILPFKYTLPALTFTVNNITVDGDKDSDTGWDEMDLTITIHANNRADAETYSGYVRTAMTRVTGSYGSETQITGNHRGESWDYIEDNTKPGDAKMGQGIFLQVINFRLVHK